MMPLTLTAPGETVSIKRITGKTQTQHFLESLGFVLGSVISVISANQSGLIVSVKGVRVALSRELANKIFVL